MTPHVKLTLSLLDHQYVLCRLDPYAGIPTWAARGDFWAVVRNAEEVSVLCPQENIPENVEAEPGWRTLELVGPLSFSQAGILDSVVEPLSHAEISILVVSAYDTSYVLLKEEVLDQAADVLRSVGHTVER